jgi:hypothetical protein
MSSTSPAPTSAPNRVWANSTIAAGIAWIILAAIPVPGTTVLGLPFGVYAIFAGLFSHGERWRAGDRTGARRARWGVGLGCLGFIIAVALDAIVVALVLGGVIAAIRVALGVHLR